MNNRSSRACLWLRVSTDSKGQDPALQRADLERVCDQRGWKVVLVYEVEESALGKKPREQFQAMLEDARKGRFDVLVVRGSLLHLFATGTAYRLLERIVPIAVPGEPHGDAWLTAGWTARAVQRRQVAMQRNVPLGAIGQAGEGGIERGGIASIQPQARGDEEQRIDAEAQCAAARIGGLSHDRGPLAEQVHHQIAGLGEGLHVGPYRLNWLNGAVAGQRHARRTGLSRDEPRLFRYVTIVHQPRPKANACLRNAPALFYYTPRHSASRI